MIEINKLTKQFGNVKAVDCLSITFNQGINGLVGENGAGKSTLLRLIADVYDEDSGFIKIDGKDHTDLKAKELVFFLPDDPFAPKNYTISQVFDLYASLFKLDKEKFEDIMSRLSLPLDRRVSTFSKGMKRQFFIAIALSSQAKYVMLDEAFDGLDPLVLDTIKQEIIQDADEKTYIVSSHNINSLQRLCDNFVILSKGKAANNANIEDIGVKYCKYQILAKSEISEKDLKKLGVDVVSFKKLGSVCNVVTTEEIDEEILNKRFDIILFEKVSIDPDELITLEMLNARKENN